jgi:glycosyltransferase involved in cell wall biosynthesis
VRILYHHRTQGTGAEGVHISQVVAQLRQLGASVDVVSPLDVEPALTAGGNPFGRKATVRGRFLGAISKRLPQSAFELLEIAYNVPAAAKLRRALDRGPVDLLYERHAFFLSAGVKLAKRHGIPYFVEVNEVAGEARVRRQRFVRRAREVESFVFEQADAILVVSEFLKQKICAVGAAAQKVHVIPNGVDEVLFDPAVDGNDIRRHFGLEANDVLVGFIGWFVPWHRLELLVRAFARTAGRTGARLMLVGDGVLRQELVELATSLGIRDRMLLPGAVPYCEIPRFIQAMDVCVIPGSNEYRSPIKLFEYMAMAKPVLAARYAPIEQVIVSGHNGLTFDPEDSADLGSKLDDLLCNPGRRAELGLRARQTILNGYLWRHNAQRVLAIYRSVTGSADASDDGTGTAAELLPGHRPASGLTNH